LSGLLSGRVCRRASKNTQEVSSVVVPVVVRTARPSLNPWLIPCPASACGTTQWHLQRRGRQLCRPTSPNRWRAARLCGKAWVLKRAHSSRWRHHRINTPEGTTSRCTAIRAPSPCDPWPTHGPQACLIPARSQTDRCRKPCSGMGVSTMRRRSIPTAEIVRKWRGTKDDIGIIR
jgi:hypothetical protein